MTKECQSSDYGDEWNTMCKLADRIRTGEKEFINDFNNTRLPAIEMSLGRDLNAEMENEDSTTVEVSKIYSRPLNGSFCRMVSQSDSDFSEYTTNGYDYMYNGVPIEDKNSFSESNAWVGNGFYKVKWHLLKKFTYGEDFKIDKCFMALVDVSKCSGKWTDKTTKSNRSTITFRNEDIDNFIVIHGDVVPKHKNLHFNAEDVE